MSLNLDNSGWKTVAFGDVVDRSREQANPFAGDVEYYVAGGHVEPGVLRVLAGGDVTDGQVGSTFTYAFHPGHVLFVSASWYLRKVGVATFDGVVADKTYVMETKDPETLDQRFLPWVLLSDHFYAYAAAKSTGSMNARLLWKTLAAYEFLLPPLDEQKRIANLLWAMERHRESLLGEARRADVALNSFLGDALASTPGEARPIVDLCDSVVGGVWGLPEGESEVDVLALGPRVYAGNPRELSTDGSPVRSVTRKQADSRVVRPGDIILERSGGSPTQPVGRVVIAGQGLRECIPTDFQRLMRPNKDVVVPEYLFWRLRYDWATGRTSNYSKKTTNISNLSVKEYLARQIKVPSLTDQASLVSQAGLFEAASIRINSENARLANARASILADIFGGD